MTELARAYQAHLIAARALDDYVVEVSFSDGVSFDVDMREIYVRPDGTPIGDPSAFASVTLDSVSDCVLWADGFHAHGEMLYSLRAAERS